MASKKKKQGKKKQPAKEHTQNGVMHTLKSSFLGALEAIWRIRIFVLVWSVLLYLFFDWVPTKCNEHVICQMIVQMMLQAPVAIIGIYTMTGLLQFAVPILHHLAWIFMVLVWPQWLLGLLVPFFVYKQKLPEEKSLKQYVHSYGVVKKHKTWSGGKVRVCTKYGVRLWRGFILVVINTHKHNRSWGGKFSIHDLRMSGHRCRITREATCVGTYANLLLDMSTLADLLIHHFKHNGSPIPYIKDLHRLMKNPCYLSSAAPTKEQFLMYLKDHPALCSPRQRILFILDLFQAYKGMSVTEKQRFDTAISHITVGGWVEAMEHANNAVLMKVLTYKKNDPANTEACYVSTATELFRFLRNFQTHGGDRKANGEQSIYNMEDLEYVAAYVHSTFVSDQRVSGEVNFVVPIHGF